jgi:hypothetical protein
MKKALRCFLLLGITAVVAACKLAVIVVEGGAVDSMNSGSCVEGKICLHSVTDPDYNETFIALPKSGWVFEKWASGRRFFCGGSTDPECHLSAQGHGIDELIGSIIASDETFYLMPVFKQTSGYPPIVGGDKEWLQPADYVEYSPRRVEAICPPPSGACSGSLPNSSFDLTGYYWASLEDIAELLNGIRQGPPISGPGLVDPLPDPPDPESLLGVDAEFLFEYFRPTYTFFEGGPQRVLSAFSLDRALDAQYYEGITIQYGIIGDGDTHIDDDSKATGAWFWRPLD